MQGRCLILIDLSALKSKIKPLPSYANNIRTPCYCSPRIYWFDFDDDRSSKETTKAKSPNLRILRRRDARKLGSSAAANNMRWWFNAVVSERVFKNPWTLTQAFYCFDIDINLYPLRFVHKLIQCCKFTWSRNIYNRNLCVHQFLIHTCR